jgi:hypothetical protein
MVHSLPFDATAPVIFFWGVAGSAGADDNLPPPLDTTAAFVSGTTQVYKVPHIPDLHWLSELHGSSLFNSAQNALPATDTTVDPRQHRRPSLLPWSDHNAAVEFLHWPAALTESPASLSCETSAAAAASSATFASTLAASTLAASAAAASAATFAASASTFALVTQMWSEVAPGLQ